MKLKIFLDLCAILFTFATVLFVSKAVFLSAEQILRATCHYSEMSWPSVAIISDKAGQKANILVSIILAILVLAFRLCSLFVNGDIPFTARYKGILLGLILVVVVSVVVYYVKIGSKTFFELNIKRAAAKDYIKTGFDQSSTPSLSGIEAIAMRYFNFWAPLKIVHYP